MRQSYSAQQIDQQLAKAAADAPLLEKEHEFDLARRWRDSRDHDALQELMSAYLRLVISMASKYRHYGLPANDLVQEGCLGLIQAADRFEPERDIRFSTYASWWIRSSIQDFILRNWSIVRTGTTSAQKKLFFNLRRLRSLIGQDTRNDSAAPITPETRGRIAAQLGVKHHEVDYMEARLSGGDSSVNMPVGDEGDAEWQDYLADERPIPEEAVMHTRDTEMRHGWLNQAMESLTEREKLIIRERRLGEETVTLAVLGDKLGISKERVRQIEHQALGKLRKSLTRLVGGDPHRAGLIPAS
ncbi:MAG: RNA polymerase factor sigma-32 [Alphaproteobacteria bacterium]